MEALSTMKKQDVIIIAAVLAVALIGLAAVRFWPSSAALFPSGHTAGPAPSSTQAPEDSGAVVRVYVGTASAPYAELSLSEDQVLEVDQGSGGVNYVEVKDGAVWMQDSTCPDKLCVGQGEMSEDNVSDRVLGNMIVCLPNQVLLELVTGEEAAS